MSKRPETTPFTWQPMEKFCGYRPCLFYYPAMLGEGHPSNAKSEVFSTDGPWPNRPPSHFMRLTKP